MLSAFTHHQRKRLLLFITSFGIAQLVHSLGQVTCWHDSIIYWGYAKYLFEPMQRLVLADRDPLYPILIWLTSSWLHSLAGILFLQMLMAAFIPLLICRTLDAVSPRLGLLAGWASLLSFLPFIFENELFTDQTHVFLLVLLAWTSAYAMLTRKPAYLYGAISVIGLLYFARPTFYALLPLAVFLIAQIRNLKQAGIAAAILILLFSANLCLRDWPHRTGGEEVRTSLAGRQAVFGVWINGANDTFDAKDGPATAKFHDTASNLLQWCMDNHPLEQCMDAHLYQTLSQAHQLPKTGEGYYTVFMHQPRYFKWEGFIQAMVKAYGGDTRETDRQFMQVATEQWSRHPALLLPTLAHRLDEIFFASYYHYRKTDNAFGYEDPPGVFLLPALVIQQCEDSGFEQYNRLAFLSQGFAEGAQRFYEFYYRTITVIAQLLSLFGAVFYGWRIMQGTRAKDAAAFAIIFFIYWLPMAAMMPFAPIVFRYHASTLLLPFMMASITLYGWGLKGKNKAL